MNIKKIATRVSIVSIVGNLILSLFKLFSGILAHSIALISDAIHSASDVISSFIVIIGIHCASKKSDKEHPYGHERIECVAAIILADILILTGLSIGYSAVKTITSGSYKELSAPGIMAIIAAAVSILVKEAMFWYTKINAKKIDSPALMADAWHHRSDALSSIGALIGVIFARFEYPIMDSIASILICIFIVKASIDIFMDAINKMIDHSCDEAMEKQMYDCVISKEGVLGIDSLTTRVFGARVYVDLEIIADGNKTLSETHAIAEEVHDTIENNFPKVKHIMVHVNPKE